MIQQQAGEAALYEEMVHALQDVKDPEIPAVSLLELGMVHRMDVVQGVANVSLLPTFVGCPALDFIKAKVARRLSEIVGIDQVNVEFVLSTPWTTDRVTEAGIEKLRQYGIASPRPGGTLRSLPECPYCAATDTQIENLFGPTACRSLYYCNTCRQPFEGMKRM